MIATMAVAETSIGAVYHKGLLRILGTILGAVLGLGTLYFAVLCNGLSHANAPGKVAGKFELSVKHAYASEMRYLAMS